MCSTDRRLRRLPQGHRAGPIEAYGPSRVPESGHQSSERLPQCVRFIVAASRCGSEFDPAFGLTAKRAVLARRGSDQMSAAGPPFPPTCKPDRNRRCEDCARLIRQGARVEPEGPPSCVLRSWKRSSELSPEGKPESVDESGFRSSSGNSARGGSPPAQRARSNSRPWSKRSEKDRGQSRQWRPRTPRCWRL